MFWFLFWVTLGGMLVPGYSALSQHASELLGAGGAGALCFRIGVIGAGVGFIGYAIFGCSMISNGIWPLGDPMHGLHALGLLTIIAPALAHLELGNMLASRRGYLVTAGVSVAGIVYLWLNLAGNDPQAFRGLTQRVFSSINSLWPCAVAWVLLKREKGTLRAVKTPVHAAVSCAAAL